MSPLSQLLLTPFPRVVPTTSEEIEGALYEALICSDEPGSLTAEPFVYRVNGQPVAGVRAQLHATEWTISGKSARAVMRRLENTREARIAQRQGLRLAATTLDQISKRAAVMVWVAKTRTAH